ncbi:MAG: LruC domain-containing protein [Saprospiraceae bacterium]|nr:LruC domain-containing protein [Saprospiraceae bacterium]
MKRFVFIASLLSVTACRPFDVPEQNATDTNSGLIDVSRKTLDQLEVPNGFTFQTVEKINLTIKAVDNQGIALKNVGFSLYLKNQNEKDSTLLLTSRTNTEGVFTTQLNLTSSAETFVVVSNYIGLPSHTVARVSFPNNEITLGDGNKNRTEIVQAAFSNNSFGASQGIENEPTSPEEVTGGFNYMGNYDNQGVPRYLTIPGDKVSQDILNMINASLPEGQPVPQYHPEYITTSAQTQLVLKDSAQVWVTFVHEGAGYRNSLGYYIFPTNKPPTTAAAISQLKVIFPNVSYVGSGGGLRTGDKVSLGNFSAGTTIGWFLVPDGWNPTQNNVLERSGYPVRYANRAFNTFTSEAYRSHVAQLIDQSRELVLIGFEDLNRPLGDNDFNDAIFFVSVNPFRAVNTAGMIPTTIYGTDNDGDGIPNNQDVAPNDPSYAFINSYPSVSGFGTLAFEDSFPFKGDYDMNDMVIDYNFEERLNAAQKITGLKATFILRAMGAGYRNGFGLELPIAANLVASATGMKLRDNYISLQANGTEKGHQRAVFIPFDNGYSLLHAPDGGFVNTEKGKYNIAPDTIQLLIKFNTSVSKTDLGYAPYNPFLIVNRERGREVHLAGKIPTALVNTALFKTGDDDTGSGSGKYYQTKKNLPWAINLPQSFVYPLEKVPINTAYLKFNQWVESKGSLFSDWYKPNAGYRDLNKIY